MKKTTYFIVLLLILSHGSVFSLTKKTNTNIKKTTNSKIIYLKKQTTNSTVNVVTGNTLGEEKRDQVADELVTDINQPTLNVEEEDTFHIPEEDQLEFFKFKSAYMNSNNRSNAKKYPILNIYLEGLKLEQKTQRENSGILIVALGGIMSLIPEIQPAGLIYMGLGSLTYVMKTSQEMTIEKYFETCNKSILSYTDQEQLARSTLSSIVTEERMSQLIAGMSISICGGLLLSSDTTNNSAKTTLMTTGGGLIILGLYTGIFMMTPHQAILESYEKSYDSRNYSFMVEPSMESGIKAKTSYSF